MRAGAVLALDARPSTCPLPYSHEDTTIMPAAMTVDTIVAASLAAHPSPVWQPYSPALTPGQVRVLEGDRARLFRLLERGDVPTVLALLADAAGQVPALEATLADELARRRDGAPVRPTIAMALQAGRG